MDKGARITGLLVFVGGVVLLVIVFISALGMLNHAQTLRITDLQKQLPTEGLALLIRVGFLFVMGYIASAIAARGIQLYEATLATPAEVTEGGKRRQVG